MDNTEMETEEFGDVVFKIEADDMEEEDSCSIGGLDSIRAMVTVGTTTDVLMTCDQGIQVPPQEAALLSIGTQVDVHMMDMTTQTLQSTKADVGVQTESVVHDAAVQLMKTVTSSAFLHLLNDKEKSHYARKLQGSSGRALKRRREEAGPSSALMDNARYQDASTMLVDDDDNKSAIFRCLGIRALEATDECGFTASTFTILLQHRQGNHSQLPMPSHWKFETKILRSHDKIKCMKLEAFSRKICGKEFLCSSDLVSHMVNAVHYNEVKILHQYCITCCTSFMNDADCLAHAEKYKDSCGCKD